MLYLDASALGKRYADEPGSDAIHSRFNSREKIFTSVLSYAEIQAALGRKFREQKINKAHLAEIRERFTLEAVSKLSIVH